MRFKRKHNLLLSDLGKGRRVVSVGKRDLRTGDSLELTSANRLFFKIQRIDAGKLGSQECVHTEEQWVRSLAHEALFKKSR